MFRRLLVVLLLIVSLHARERATYIPVQVRSVRAPLKKQKETQRHAAEVADATRCKGAPKYY